MREDGWNLTRRFMKNMNGTCGGKLVDSEPQITTSYIHGRGSITVLKPQVFVM